MDGKAADFVSEDDVKRAIQKGEKIYVGPKTIITPVRPRHRRAGGGVCKA